MSTTASYKHSSGITLPVWESTCPTSSYPQFRALKKDTSTSLLIVGSGIAGITTAYEAHKTLKKPIVLVDARSVIAGETQRTTGHLSSGDQGDRFYNLIDTFGEAGAKKAYESHAYAVHRVGEIAKELGIECEYRDLSAKIIKAPEEKNDLKDEHEACQKLGIPSSYQESAKLGRYQGPILTIADQGAFHPTKYLVGILEYLKKQTDFTAYTDTRYISHESADGQLKASLTNADGAELSIVCDQIVMATNMPPRKISHVIKQHYMRSYVVAAPVPKGSIEDVLIYDNKDPYIYVRKSEHPDKDKEYLIIGGEDHKVGIEDQESYHSHFSNLEAWGREHFPEAMGQVEFKWSGQVVENAEGLAYIGQSGEQGEYIVTGDNGNGLTHGTLAAKIIVDAIAGRENPWSEIYSPSRLPTKAGLSGIYETVKENVVQQKEYVRLVAVDTGDIEDIAPCSGSVIRGSLGEGLKPIAIYKDKDGKICRFSALCPHMKGVVAWNPIEKSWDCPNHGSRFVGETGECVMGPAKMGLHPQNDLAEDNAKDSANV